MASPYAPAFSRPLIQTPYLVGSMWKGTCFVDRSGFQFCDSCQEMACRLDSRVVSVGVWQVQYDLTAEYPEANDEFVKKEDYFRRVHSSHSNSNLNFKSVTADVVLTCACGCLWVGEEGGGDGGFEREVRGAAGAATAARPGARNPPPTPRPSPPPSTHTHHYHHHDQHRRRRRRRHHASMSILD